MLPIHEHLPDDAVIFPRGRRDPVCSRSRRCRCRWFLGSAQRKEGARWAASSWSNEWRCHGNRRGGERWGEGCAESLRLGRIKDCAARIANRNFQVSDVSERRHHEHLRWEGASYWCCSAGTQGAGTSACSRRGHRRIAVWQR